MPPDYLENENPRALAKEHLNEHASAAIPAAAGTPPPHHARHNQCPWRQASSSRPARHRYSIPYIKAEGEEDAWYGVGFCQGQDRAYQLEILLRVARGTLASLFVLKRGMDGLDLHVISRAEGL